MTIFEVNAWVKEGCNSYAAHCIPPAGYELRITGYRVRRPDGSTVRPAYPPFKTRDEAEAYVASLEG